MERFDFFKNVEDKYKNKISLKKPLILRFDGKGVTKNSFIDLCDEKYGSFSDCLKKTAKYMSEKYRCISYVANDEINLIFDKPMSLSKTFKTVDIQKLNSLISQELFYYFNKLMNTKNPVYFDCRCFNIPEDKLNSYIKYRINSSINTAIQYFAKRNIEKEYRHGLKLDEIISNLEEHTPSFKIRTLYQKEGLLYKKGIKVVPSKFLL